MDIKRELWRIVDKLELIQIPQMFSDAAKTNMLTEAINMLKACIKDIEDSLK